MGKWCDNESKEFMLCRYEEADPRYCIKEGKAVTACGVDFLNRLKKHCYEEFTQYWQCVDYRVIVLLRRRDVTLDLVTRTLDLITSRYDGICRSLDQFHSRIFLGLTTRPSDFATRLFVNAQSFNLST